MNLEQLRARMVELADLMEAINASGDTLTDEQTAEFEKLSAEFDDVSAKIKALEAAEARRATVAGARSRLAEPRPSAGQVQVTSASGPMRAGGDPAVREFENDAEAWQAYVQHLVRRGRGENDPRLDALWGQCGSIDGFALPGLRGEQSMGTGAEGGFAVPSQFRPDLVEVPVAQPIVRPRAMVIPAGDPPDAELTMPALDQSSSIHGGVSVVWYGEGDTQTETDADIRPITLKPNEVGAFITTSDKLLRNWAAAAALLPRLLRSAITSEEDLRFIQGDGVAKPQGFSSHASAKAITRDTANEIKYEDLVAMEAELVNEAMPVFLTSRRQSAQLRLLQSPEGHLIWGNGNANEGRPPTLLGYPVVYAPRFPALGSRGDIILADLRYYAIKDGSGPFVASSEHVNFTSNKTVIKAVWNVDGQPLLNAVITDEDGQTYTPFAEIAA